MKYLVALLVVFAGCSQQADQSGIPPTPPGGFGWSPPPETEADREKVYGAEAPQFQTLSEILEQEKK